MSRVVRFHQTGGPEVLKIENLDVRPPGRGEVRIAVKALGLNRAESMFRSGHYLEDPKLPGATGLRGGGNRRGDRRRREGIQGRRRGQHDPRVLAESSMASTATRRSCRPRAVAKHPASLSWTEAAAIWMQYATAYGALIEFGEPEGGRHAADSGRVEQRRHRGDSDRQHGRRDADRPDAQAATSARPLLGARRGARHRHRRARSGRRGARSSPAARVPASCSTPSAGRPSPS